MSADGMIVAHTRVVSVEQPCRGLRRIVLAGPDLEAASGDLMGLLPPGVADLHALDRLDAHERPRQPRVEAAVPVHVGAQADRHAVRQHLHDAAEGLPGAVGVVDLGDHRRRGLRVDAADRVGVEAGL